MCMSLLTSLFGGGPPAPVAAPAPPSPEDPNVRLAGEAERRRMAAARGRASTILTGGLGATGGAFSARKTLLGE